MNNRTVLLLLCIAFAAYTVCVYRYSDGGPQEAPSAAIISGKQIWQEKNCQSCHQLYGLGGYVGPDLTNVAAKGAEHIRAFIRRGTARMPDFHLSAQEMNELTAFLQWVDKTGTSRVSDSSVHWTGSYQIKP
jgi:nitric oxide reductase subunit C